MCRGRRVLCLLGFLLAPLSVWAQQPPAPPARVMIPLENCTGDACTRVREAMPGIPGVQNVACNETGVTFDVQAGRRVTLEQVKGALEHATTDPEHPIRPRLAALELSGTVEIWTANYPDDKDRDVATAVGRIRGIRGEHLEPGHCKSLIEGMVRMTQIEEAICGAVGCAGGDEHKPHVVNVAWTPPATVPQPPQGGGQGHG